MRCKILDVWSPVELLHREGIRELQMRKLKKVLAYAYNKKIYRKKFNEYGIHFKDIKTIEDISKLPFTEKNDIVYGIKEGLYNLKDEKIHRWHQTSGTTGDPVKIVDSEESWGLFADLSASALYGMGVRKNDTALVAFGYGPFIAFWGYIAGLEKIGASFVPSGGLSSNKRVEMIRDFNVTVLMATPSYTLHLIDVASQIGVNLSDFLKKTIHTGEPCTPNVKKRIKKQIGIRPLDRIGTTETGGFAFECPHNQGIYHIQENYHIAKILDPELEEPVAPGETGELILTPLYRFEMPVIRFKTRNLVRLADIEKCNCGRNFISLEETAKGVVIQRLDHLIKIRGVLINPITIEEIIRNFEEIKEYQVILHKNKNVDEITVKAEINPGVKYNEIESIKEQLENILKDKLLVRFNVELVPKNTLPKYDGKSKKVLDLR